MNDGWQNRQDDATGHLLCEHDSAAVGVYCLMMQTAMVTEKHGGQGEQG